jgi:protein-disulfide isomerase
MRFFHIVLMLLATAMTAVSSPAAAPKRPDWVRIVAQTPIGGYLVGNPKAANKLVKYVSYTCPHCAHFEAEGLDPLIAGWINPGTMNMEVRNLVRDRYDLTAALLARCGAPSRFMGNSKAIFDNQESWLKAVVVHNNAPSTLPQNAKQSAVFADIAYKTGLIPLMIKRGYTKPQLNACLANPNTLKTLLNLARDAAVNQQITGTPSFILNGALTPAYDWKSLRDLLPGALPARQT